jgi:hypothetical protein
LRFAPIAKATSTTNTYGAFFLKLKKKFFTWEVKQRAVLEVNFFLLKKKGPMGVVEGCLGYWCRDGNYNGYFC